MTWPSQRREMAGKAVALRGVSIALDREMAVRGDKRLTNRLAIAKLRFPDACIENIDFAAHRGLDRRQLLSLAQGEWLKAHEHLILTGQTGTVERYNRTVRHEWLDQHIIESIEEAQEFATQWLWTYNNERPNMGIGGITPAQKLKMAA